MSENYCGHIVTYDHLDETHVQYGYAVSVFKSDLVPESWGYEELGEALATAILLVRRNVSLWLDGEERPVYHHLQDCYEFFTVTGYTMHNERAWMK